MILVLYQSAKHQESLYVLHHNQVKEEGDLPEVREKRCPNLRAKIIDNLQNQLQELQTTYSNQILMIQIAKCGS